MINDKSNDTVATCLRYGWIVNNLIKKVLLLSLSVKKCLKSVNIFAKLQARMGSFFVFYRCGGQVHKVHETTTFLCVT